MKRILLLQAFLAFILVLPASGQKDTIPASLQAADTLDTDFGFFTNDGILNLALRFDTREYMRSKPKEEYLPAILTYYINDKDSINRTIKLKSRGEFRNSFCDFPPLRLNFKKGGFEKADLKKIETIKVVTHCQSGNEDYLFKEYLVYKLYNVLTDQSFSVRLAKIDYISTSAKKTKTISSYCFFIEPADNLADRLSTVVVETPNVTQRNILPEMMNRMAIFNYMIGNTDWSVPNQHNVKVFAGRDFDNPGLGMIVPYDFDYSGIVDASYAVPFEGLGLRSVRERRYLGECRTEEEFLLALKEFSAKKPEFYKVINEFQYMDERDKKGMTKYLDEFFDRLDKPSSLVGDMKRGCYNFDK
jgi:hypothetical protein